MSAEPNRVIDDPVALVQAARIFRRARERRGGAEAVERPERGSRAA